MNRQEPILKSLAVIEEKIQEKLTVESLAGSLHFSRYHYQRLFREAVGESVMRYVARRRIFLAAKELASTDLSILEIALKYGYDSHEGFSHSLEGITNIARCPDQISARFLIIKAIEDAAFWTSITDFQVRLTIARAKPQHRALFEPLCRKYEDLAQNARMKAGKIADFLGELSALIFQDMRENAAEKLQNAIWLGESAAKRLWRMILFLIHGLGMSFLQLWEKFQKRLLKRWKRGFWRIGCSVRILSPLQPMWIC